MSLLNASTLRNRLQAKGRFRHMQAFVETADLGSLNKAAQTLGLTQPAVTHQIREFEGMLGVDLFVRHAKGMRLSEAGERLLPVSRRILRSLDDSAWQAAAHIERIRGYVRVGAVGNALHAVLCECIAAFCDVNPQIVVEIEEAPPALLGGKLLHGEVDLGLCRSTQALPDGWKFEPLMPDRFCAVTGPRHPLVGRKRVSWSELSQSTWLVPPLDTTARAGFEELFLRDGKLPPMYNISTRAPVLMWRLLDQRNLLSFMPKSVADPFLRSGLLAEVRLPQTASMPGIGLVVKAEVSDSASAALAGFLRKRFAGDRRGSRA
ncbi:DNA-binding transcriptional regulator, LysR family [Variovorax sp. YR266]|uniref:LysR family transcriptional regulator n=1 Tax=Variovorax sp. YR266 TaxID=1884386 RepID=UPI00089B7877|nr:LysR family transcriptional regulator [Variovorax sp. YR266]SDZ70816.1 DNA-binding transcriptional regulator, LysR family [Variovorax sp. YR266]